MKLHRKLGHTTTRQGDFYWAETEQQSFFA
jgi:hypothetical protein